MAIPWGRVWARLSQSLVLRPAAAGETTDVSSFHTDMTLLHFAFSASFSSRHPQGRPHLRDAQPLLVTSSSSKSHRGQATRSSYEGFCIADNAGSLVTPFVIHLDSVMIAHQLSETSYYQCLLSVHTCSARRIFSGTANQATRWGLPFQTGEGRLSGEIAGSHVSDKQASSPSHAWP